MYVPREVHSKLKLERDHSTHLRAVLVTTEKVIILGATLHHAGEAGDKRGFAIGVVSRWVRTRLASAVGRKLRHVFV